MNGIEMVVLGDSVTWGQGLLAQHKSATLVANGRNTLFPGIQPVILAHSGAVIGRAANCATTLFPGEVPESCPSILQQIAAYSGDPGSVPFVLSSASQFDFVPSLLEFMGAPLPQFLGADQFVLGNNRVVEKIVSLCIQFWQQSSQMPKP